jgi:integrating conjugative element protein (TIGR03759 family)|nr:TIGR03759 family integrating conjugative element protein [uncultured Caldimonas sp.]
MHRLLTIALAGLALPGWVWANPPSTASTAVLSRSQSTPEQASAETQARDWGLRAEEWARYRLLMQGPLGVHSPNLDPLTALGIEARTDEERRRYAELQVQVEARRVQKLLAYQRAYDAAWQRLFPKMQRVDLPEPNRRSSDAVSGRVAVFVKPDCPACRDRVRQLQRSGQPFDVYMVGSRQDDALLRRWAREAGIEPARVQARSVTLNHDTGRWLSLGLPGGLPAVVRQVNGTWQRLPR